MRTIAIAAAALLALGASAPASAQIFPRIPGIPGIGGDYRAAQEIERRLDMIYERIERARRTREISNRDALQLHGYGQRIFDRYRFLRSDGLDRWEYEQLSRATNGLRQRIEQVLRYGQDWRYGERRDDDWRDRRDRDWDDRRSDRDWEDDDWHEDWGNNGEWNQRGDDRWSQNERREREEPWQDETWQDNNNQSGNEPDTDYDQDDWWLPPEERESIESRPGDHPGEI